MGDGNFVGGGSVDWEVNNQEDGVTSKPEKYKGKDKTPPKQTGGMFSIKVNGVRVIDDFLMDGKTIRIEWTPDIKP